ARTRQRQHACGNVLFSSARIAAVRNAGDQDRHPEHLLYERAAAFRNCRGSLLLDLERSAGAANRCSAISRLIKTQQRETCQMTPASSRGIPGWIVLVSLICSATIALTPRLRNAWITSRC